MNARSVAWGILASILVVLAAPALVVGAAFVHHVSSYEGMCAPLHIRPYPCGWNGHVRVFVELSSVMRLTCFSALALLTAVSLVAGVWLGVGGARLAKRLPN